MKNIRVVSESHIYLPPTKWICSQKLSSIFCGSSNAVFEVLDNSGSFKKTEIPLNNERTICFEFLFAENAMFLATSEGTMLVCWETQAAVVCEFPGTITACKWSPDQELLVLTNYSSENGGSLSLMAADWAVILTQALNPSEFGELSPQTVGWGKKETQFHGSEGKDAAKTKHEVPVAASFHDDKLPRISWRADSQFFAVSSVDPSTRSRVIRVYDRQGFLQSTSEPVSGLQFTLAWKPSGSLIASSINTTTKLEIVFFEKNGLRHGEFSLLPVFPDVPKDSLSVREICWNTTSEVLLIWVVREYSSGGSDHIQLWTCSNYHWYLKQSLVYPQFDSNLVATSWSHSSPYRLHLLDSTGRLTSLEFSFDICRSSDLSSTVIIIDGTDLLLTSFRFSAVPPPSSRHTLSIGACVNDVAINSFDKFYELAVLTDKKEILVFLSSTSDPGTPPKLSAIYEYPFLSHSGIYWLSSTILAATEPARKDDTDVWGLWTVSIKKQSEKELESLQSLEFMDDDKMCRLISYLDVPVDCMISTTSATYLFFSNGLVGKFEPGSDETVVPYLKLPEKCDHFFVYTHKQTLDVFAHSSTTHRLYRNTSLVTDSCTSFVVAKDFLLYTTHRHKLVCIPLCSEKFGLMSDEREVERGCRLITAVSNQTDVVLQLPRGNLEIIHPRSLVIAKVTQFVSVKNYKEAFDLMRVHRLDMNLLVDLDPNSFLSSISYFVQQIQDSSSLNLFIASLNDENVTATVYQNHFLNPTSTISNKRNTVLDRLEIVLQNSSRDLLLSMLACYIYKKPQQLEKALFKVKELRDNPGTFSAEDALKFVLYSADVNELFNIALGTYDFDLVLMVAAKSRKDPKEYIPFLNQFRSMQPAEYRHFCINKHLKRYEKALKDLASLGMEKFQELTEFVVLHSLYQPALEIYKESDSTRSTILKLYGNCLAVRKNYLEAGIAYEECGHLTEAFENFKKAGNWQLAVSCAFRADWDEKQREKNLELMILILKSSGRNSEAARIQLDFLSDPSKAFLTLLDGHCWEDAYLVRMTKVCGIGSEKKFVLALKEASAALVEQIARITVDFNKYTDRLVIVRKDKLEKSNMGTGDIRDDFSETSSISEGSTRSSQMSRMSSKNRRKEEKKKRSLREGGRYEDLALLDALRNIFVNVNALISEVGSLLKFLAIYKEIQFGVNLQRSFDALVQICNQRKPSIWNSDSFLALSSARPSGYVFGPNATANMIVSHQAGPFGDSDVIGEYSLSDLALFVPSELNVSSWNGYKMDHFTV